MSDPEFPLCDKNDPRVPVVLDMLRKSQFMGGNFTLDARRILAALDEAFPPGRALGWAVVEHTHAGIRVDGWLHETREAAASDCDQANEEAQTVPIDYTVAVLIEEQTGGGNG
ncbi:hypothetical protein AB0C10_37575 [Microbispora amethystogenes]|uniref:hypothetical protein n=1 Tax=Microbispora amethystogenes TaxID=1427754 RepID=UPI0033EF4149